MCQWIRRSRLERCRRDLLDPALSATSRSSPSRAAGDCPDRSISAACSATPTAARRASCGATRALPHRGRGRDPGPPGDRRVGQLRRGACRRGRRPRRRRRPAGRPDRARTGPARRPSSTRSAASSAPAAVSSSTGRTSPPAAPRAGAARAGAHVAVDRALRRPEGGREPARRSAPAFGVADAAGDRVRSAQRLRGDRLGGRPARPGGDRGRAAERPVAGAAQARRHRARARREAAAGLPRRAGRRARHARERGARDGGCAASPTSGQAMLLVDHDMGLVLGICDEVVVLEFGKVIARGAADDGSPRPEGRRGLSRQRGRRGSRRTCARASMPDAVLSLEGLTAGYDQAAVIRGVDLTVAAGEVVALLGANGAGKTTIAARRLRARQADGRPRSSSTAPTSRAHRRAAVRSSASRTCRRAAASSSG